MTRQIPVFRFVFAAYYAISNQWRHEDEGVVRNAGGFAKSEFPTLALVVNNDVEAARQKGPWLGERAWECNIE